MRLVTKLAALAAFAAAVSTAGAAVLVSDTFPTDGSLVGTTPAVGGTWTTFSGANGPIQVVSGAAQVVQAPTATASIDVSSAFVGGGVAAGTVVYSSFDLTVPDPGAAITPVYFAAFLEGTGNFNGRIWITTPAGGSGYRLAISNDNSISDNDGEVFSADLAFGTTYKIVHSYDRAALDARMWINPADASSPSLEPADPGFNNAVSQYAFRQGSPGTGGSTQIIDNLVVATSFGEVIPEPASLSLLAAPALLTLRRRRA